MVNHMNHKRADHIVTIEDPIEYLFEDGTSIVTQREVGMDAPGFAEALRICLRQDPNVVMVGEMRDVETMQTVLTLAETGHLVLSTLHTITAAETVNRIISQFPPGLRASDPTAARRRSCAASISQRLMERSDEPGLIPAVEVLVGTLTVQRCIEEPTRTAQLGQVIAEGRDTYGMQTFNQSAIEWYQKGMVSYEEARRTATSQTDFEVEVERLSLAQDVATRKTATAVPGRPVSR